LPNYATIDKEDRVKFWRRVARCVRACDDCKYILQISHSGRQQDLGGVENFHRVRWSSTNRRDPVNGFRCRRMKPCEIKLTIRQFAEAAKRAQDAKVDGIELHSANGYLFTQFLSSAINNRKKNDYGGREPKDRARFLVEVIETIRKEVGIEFFLMVKLSVVEHYGDPLFLPFFHGKGNALEDSKEVARLAVEAGADAIHVSTGGTFPHPRNPAGRFPIEVAQRTYGTLLSNDDYSFYNYLSFRYQMLWPLACWRWEKNLEFIKGGIVQPELVEGLNLLDARRVKKALKDRFPDREVPVLCTGGFQHAARIVEAINDDGDLPAVDGVTMGRTLLANPDLPNVLKKGAAGPSKPCTYCNKCLLFVVDHPLGCYDESRFIDYDDMMSKLMEFYQGNKADTQGNKADTAVAAAPRPQPAPKRVGLNPHWPALFRVKAVWNWALCALFLVADGKIKQYLHVTTPTDPVYRTLFLSSAAVFGIGFWRVSNAMSSRREVIFLGILAQLCVFGLSALHLALGHIHPLQAIPGVVDLIFAGLFLYVYGGLLGVPRRAT
jgi:2,4-dienoyl-CoA reductase (NADPH2)